MVLHNRKTPSRNPPIDRIKYSHKYDVSTDSQGAMSPASCLPDNSLVVVVGGGPAGSFFAIRLLRRARAAGKRVRVMILERKTEVCFYGPVPFALWEGCNYCAGGISPRLVDALHEEHITIPEEIIESRAEEVVIHADWKSILLPVPPGRQLLSVFRGSRPYQRDRRYLNFDTWLLNLAAEQGAQVITGEAVSVRRSLAGRPVVLYRRTGQEVQQREVLESVEADFLVVASGVNRHPGEHVTKDPFLAELRSLLPQFRPPKVRRAVIAEMTDEHDQLGLIAGEMHFTQYGAKDLHIYMASVMPKNTWLTTAILGKSVDTASAAQLPALVERFLALPSVRRLIPHRARLRLRCLCNPNMTVGVARRPFGDQVALVGDLAVARLYKDGLYSAYLTAAALCDCLLDRGTDAASLRAHYGQAVKRLHSDNRYGRLIFLLSGWVLAHPTLSRVLYQAVITERMTKLSQDHRLAPLLWNVASGDESYRRTLFGMLHPTSLWRILKGGLLRTARDRITELVFGLDWGEIPRYGTGVPLERLHDTRGALFAAQGLEPPPQPPQMESMFTVRIRADKQAILRQLGKFGDLDRQYLKPRFVRIERISGEPNKTGSVIRYEVPLVRLSFDVTLERVERDRLLLYRISKGFGQGGLLAFLLDDLRPGVSLLTIYVGFDFPKGQGIRRIIYALARWLFPRFAHDVVWNHSLCRIRQLAELDAPAPAQHQKNDRGSPAQQDLFAN